MEILLHFIRAFLYEAFKVVVESLTYLGRDKLYRLNQYKRRRRKIRRTKRL